jgi:hypothetical protein
MVETAAQAQEEGSEVIHSTGSAAKLGDGRVVTWELHAMAENAALCGRDWREWRPYTRLILTLGPAERSACELCQF